MELCKHFSSSNYKAILIIPSNLSSSVPSSLRGLSLVEVVEIPNSPSPSPPHPPLPPPSEMTPPPASLPEMLDGSRTGPGFGPGLGPLRHHHQQMGSGLEAYLSQRCGELGQTRPVCAVLDVIMSWSNEFFVKFEIPTISFLTSGSCSAAMEHAGWKAQVGDMKPGEIRKFDGLPEDMELSYSDLKRQEHGPRRHGGNVGGLAMAGPNGPDGGNGSPNGMKFAPPGAGSSRRWLDEVEGSSALFFNTCNDLEHPFIKYIADQTDIPVYGVGPLLPEKYWKSSGSILHDSELRSNRKSNYTEDQVVQWMDSKPHQSVIYVAFGSAVGPSLEEYAELAHALGVLNRPFIWVIQPNSGRAGPPPGPIGDESGSQTKEEGFYAHGLEEKVGDRGLVINGWAPQLLILSHPALGGFLSHCGWNSTVESIARGVPILAWPIRGDQFHNAKLVVKHLKVGHMLRTGDDPKEMVKKDGIIRGIDNLLDDKEVHKQAVAVRSRFKNGFPASSVAALKSFLEAIVKKN